MPPKIPLSILSSQLSSNVDKSDHVDADANTNPKDSADNNNNNTITTTSSSSFSLLNTFQNLARIADAETESAADPIESAFRERIRLALRGYVRSVLLPPSKR